MRLPRHRRRPAPRFRLRFHWSVLAVVPAAVGVALMIIVVDPHGGADRSLSPHADRSAHPDRPRASAAAGASCRIRTRGSQVAAYCHNPYPEPDALRLHVECARWWDIDADGPETVAGPAMTVRLTGRCWKEVGSAWVSHRH